MPPENFVFSRMASLTTISTAGRWSVNWRRPPQKRRSRSKCSTQQVHLHARVDIPGHVPGFRSTDTSKRDDTLLDAPFNPSCPSPSNLVICATVGPLVAGRDMTFRSTSANLAAGLALVLLCCFAVTFLTGCPDETSPSDDAGVEDAVSTEDTAPADGGDADLRSIDGTDTDLPLPDGLSIEVVASETFLEIGDTLQLEAVVRDSEEHEIEGVEVGWMSSDPSALPVDDAGLVTAEEPGMFDVFAFAGDVYSETVLLHVRSVRDTTTRTVTAVTELPESLGDRELVIATGLGSEPVELDDDGNAELTVLAHDNQAAFASDPETGTPLLIKIFRGENDEFGDDDEAMNMYSTAEALLLLTPGIAHPSPYYVEVVRSLMADSPEIEQLALVLEDLSADGGSWADHMDVVEHELTKARVVLGERLEPYLRLEPAQQKSLAVLTYPAEQDGLVIVTTPCMEADLSEWPECAQNPETRVAVEVENHHVRYVHVRFQPADMETYGNALTPPSGTIASATMMQGFWQALYLLATDFTLGFASPNSIKRVLRLDPADRGAPRWHVLTYGPALNWPASEVLAVDSLWPTRMVGPWLRTLIFDVAFNLWSIIGPTDPPGTCRQEIEDFILDIQGDTAVLNDIYSQLQGVDKANDILIDGLWSRGIGALLNCVGRSFSNPQTLEGLIAKQTLSFLTTIVKAWDVCAAGVQILMVDYAVFADRFMSLFTLAAEEEDIHPRSRWLPQAELGCLYSTQLWVVPTIWMDDSEATFTWSAFPAAEGWTVTPMGEQGQWLTVETTNVTEEMIFPSRNYVPVSVSVETSWGFAMTDNFNIPVGASPPTIEGYGWTNPGDGFAPGATATLSIEASTCLELGRNIDSGTVEGLAITGIAPLGLQGEGLVGTVTVESPLDDGVTYTLTATVLTTYGEQISTIVPIPVGNVAPVVAGPFLYRLTPGETYYPRISVWDANYVGTNLSEIPVSHVGTPNQSLGLDTTPLVGNLSFRRAATPPELGDALTFESRTYLRVSSPHPDNDGATGTDEEALANAHTITIEVTDDNGAVGTQDGFGNATIAVVVNNVAPVISEAPTRLVVWDEGPAEIPVVVTDDNGIADIDSVEVVGPSYGIVFADASDVDDTRVFRFETTSLDLPEECDPECTISFQAVDADDVPDNGGLSEVVDVLLQQDPGPPCEDNDDCTGGQYCWANGNQCDAELLFCQDKPTECAAVELGASLACGCDGSYYLSSCLAEVAGVTPEIGADPSVCTPTDCTDSADCDPGAVCLLPDGLCGGVGTCVVSPPECAASTPVCGCDGQTHASFCEAVKAGVSVLSPGTCGQTCADHRDCAYGQTCYKVAGDCFGQGVCVRIEATCDDDSGGPVCGCDGQAHDCGVAALAAFTSVAHVGACVACTPENGPASGCGVDEVCKATAGCDEPGVCVPVDVDCDQNADDPVCGCDGVLHKNACVTALASVALSDTDFLCACDGPENIGGTGDDGSACPELSYCDRSGCRGGGYCTPTAWLDCGSQTDVCSCDGTTQDDLCDAELSGLGATTSIVCEPDCRADVDCPIGQFCEFSSGCGGTGECRVRPAFETCSATSDVCGCDGITYSSDCLRQAYGASKGCDGACATCDPSEARDCDDPLHVCARRIAYCDDALGEGACIVTPFDYSECDDRFAPFCDCEYTFKNVCHAVFFSYTERPPYQALTIPADQTELGGCPCDDDTTCFSPNGNTFCLRDEPGCTGSGFCVFPEQFADMTWGPGAVCGCDGKTYDNRGDAYAAGVNISCEGACGDACDLDKDCTHVTDGYCELVFGTCGGVGTCRSKPLSGCEGTDPGVVCGCDGERYSTACSAAQAGVSVAYLGECQPCQRTCDDFTQTCTYPVGECPPSEPPYPTGACIDRPVHHCPDGFDPVCACNGFTYDSFCEARNAQVNVKDIGYCTCSAGSDSVPCIHCIYREQPSCVDEWTDDCEAVGLGACLDECRCPEMCCEPQDHAGCDIPACQACVGALRPSCETDVWDAECVRLAATTCDAFCPCLGDACEVHDLPGTQSSRCWGCVCGEDPTCCSTSWHAGCVELAEGTCRDPWCRCSGPCCEPHDIAGCNDETCEDAVCAERSQCCDAPWDTACAAIARRLCPELCPSGSCCEAHDGLGCDSSACETTVCGTMVTCCADNWGEPCASEATTACAPLCDKGPCCIPSDATSGCTDPTCETAVCATQPSCCDTLWDASCAALAESTCGALCAPQSCCEAHGDTRGCDDATCEASVCGENPACCAEVWSAPCAATAETLCSDLCGSGTPCSAMSPCPAGQYCSPEGFCVGGAEPECYSDFDCGAGEYCDGGVCKTETLIPCDGADVCPPGYYCDGEYCREG